MDASDYYESLRAKVGAELIYVPSTAAVIRNENNEILFLKAENGEWDLPTGAMEPGETPSQSLIRKVWEETGLNIQPIQLQGVFTGKDFRHTYENGNQVEYVMLCFECVVRGGRLDAGALEAGNLAYYSSCEIPQLVLPYPDSLFADFDHSASFF
ncbi:NUDIX domain-containing protein [Sinobaca sp. H24]|uniref:NUDIX domain-containing protein n=1 Tax=Sinobaca sp. H24 TaxID=2923376 RepID=UPI002079BC24|nr:NUDIX domain-containing protein [Sinobaca sp. H24]